jgi:hypothetical protein
MSDPPRRTGVLKWDIGEIARALKISEGDVKEYFADGRRVSFLLERRICAEVLHGTLAPSEGAGFDLIDSDGGKWEVRSISKDGVYFCPSLMVGSGRRFEEQGFLAKLSEIEGYVLSDIESFLEIPFWIVTADEVRDWWHSGELGVNSKINREKALRVLS